MPLYELREASRACPARGRGRRAKGGVEGAAAGGGAPSRSRFHGAEQASDGSSGVDGMLGSLDPREGLLRRASRVARHARRPSSLHPRFHETNPCRRRGSRPAHGAATSPARGAALSRAAGGSSRTPGTDAPRSASHARASRRRASPPPFECAPLRGRRVPSEPPSLEARVLATRAPPTLAAGQPGRLGDRVEEPLGASAPSVPQLAISPAASWPLRPSTSDTAAPTALARLTSWQAGWIEDRIPLCQGHGPAQSVRACSRRLGSPRRRAKTQEAEATSLYLAPISPRPSTPRLLLRSRRLRNGIRSPLLLPVDAYVALAVVASTQRAFPRWDVARLRSSCAGTDGCCDIASP